MKNMEKGGCSVSAGSCVFYKENNALPWIYLYEYKWIMDTLKVTFPAILILGKQRAGKTLNYRLVEYFNPPALYASFLHVLFAYKQHLISPLPSCAWKVPLELEEYGERRRMNGSERVYTLREY